MVAAVFQAERRACPEMKSKGSPTSRIYGRSLTRLKYAAFQDDASWEKTETETLPKFPALPRYRSSFRSREHHLALPVHHKTFPTMRQSEPAVMETASYSRRSETSASM